MFRRSLIPLVALAVATSSHASAMVVADSKHPTSKTTPHVSAAEMHLRIGDTYEKHGQFNKAEQEYVIAAIAENSTPDTQIHALNSVERILKLSTDRNLQIAEIYEHKEQWSDAETYYLKAATLLERRRGCAGDIWASFSFETLAPGRKYGRRSVSRR